MKALESDLLARILRLLKVEHGYEVEELEKIQGALRAYEKPLLDLVEALLKMQQETEALVFPLVFSAHFQGSALCQYRNAQEKLRQRVATLLIRREALSRTPIGALL